MRITHLVVLLACFVTPLQLCADLWTNQAGRVIEARLEAFDGATVTLVRTNGSQLKLPLSALSHSDQNRVRLKSGKAVAPAFVHDAFRDAKEVLEKFERLPDEQRTDEARVAATRMACAIFDARLKPRMQELKAPSVLAEVRRLRAALNGQ
jgi:hypothetical protein